MRDYLTFQLYGPTASWGSIAVGDERPSFDRPSKSAVLGLIAAALGYRRREQEKHDALRRSLAMALRIENGGTFFRDYHTIQVPSKTYGDPALRSLELAQLGQKDTKVSTREYYADQRSLVCLWQTEEAEPSLRDLAAALRTPRFHLYLGRKASPLALPLCPRVAAATSWKEALGAAGARHNRALTLLLGAPREAPAPAYYWEGDDHAGFGDRKRVEHQRWDAPATRDPLVWQFQPRTEYSNLSG
jgi:CRISPR system Cascade subunit CasD